MGGELLDEVPCGGEGPLDGLADIRRRFTEDQVPSRGTRYAVEAVPLRRIGTPGEVSDTVLFVLSDASRFVTGHTLVVDGGGRHR
ncbi:SDR family oxidoreductase [Streptomyces sp. SP18BB07]|uniref:SDR family oxidoreductase n=1 Tax=Streptomyces sp. SP18BB07 TaxID=3002522 RepID=UPI002E79757F|nr:SDR family oxidoreductase [Streptomyces sp. SP18BB07]MEE1765188.1 SDR family oxidoreductase [Streptomyces sp. SP18BB07]